MALSIDDLVKLMRETAPRKSSEGQGEVEGAAVTDEPPHPESSLPDPEVEWPDSNDEPWLDDAVAEKPREPEQNYGLPLST